MALFRMTSTKLVEANQVSAESLENVKIVNEREIKNHPM